MAAAVAEHFGGSSQRPRTFALRLNSDDANNGDHADTVADDLNNKVIARFLEEV